MFGFAAKYIHNHRRYLADASRINKIHHGKEIFVRLVIGCFAGMVATQVLFGNRANDNNLVYAVTEEEAE